MQQFYNRHFQVNMVKNKYIYSSVSLSAVVFLQVTPPVLCSPVEIVEEGQDKEEQLAPGLLLAELERVTIHHGRWVVEHLLGIRWGMEVPATEGKNHTPGSWPVPDYKDMGGRWERWWGGGVGVCVCMGGGKVM